MTETLKQIIKREVDKLSKDGQEAVNSLDWVKIIEEIGQKYLLDESEIEDLQTQTLLVLIGLRDADLYATGIENKVGTSKEQAEKIAEEVFQKIFTPIGNIIIENIKKSGKHQNANTEQNLDFILSGGDYSAFVTQNSPLPEYSALRAEGSGSIPPPLDKGRTAEGSLILDPHPTSPLSRGRGRDIDTSQEGNIPAKPRKMDDIRSKFTI